jgi:hypothetical protein
MWRQYGNRVFPTHSGKSSCSRGARGPGLTAAARIKIPLSGACFQSSLNHGTVLRQGSFSCVSRAFAFGFAPTASRRFL